MTPSRSAPTCAGNRNRSWAVWRRRRNVDDLTFNGLVLPRNAGHVRRHARQASDHPHPSQDHALALERPT